MDFLSKEQLFTQRTDADGFLPNVYNSWITSIQSEGDKVYWHSDNIFMSASDKIVGFIEDAEKLLEKYPELYITTRDLSFSMCRMKIMQEGSVIYITVDVTNTYFFSPCSKYVPIFPNKKVKKETIAFFADGDVRISYGGTKTRFIPLSFRKISFLFCNHMFYLFVKSWLIHRTEPIYRDILRDYERGCLSCAISLMEVRNYHSYQDLIKGHYKTCKDVPKSVNKMPLDEAVAKALLCRDIKKEEQQKIYQINIPLKGRRKKSPDERNILCEYYEEVLRQPVTINGSQYDASDLCTILKDYYAMAKALNQKINLKIKSARKLIDAHNNLVTPYAEKMAQKTGTRKMKVDNKFKNLALPDSWELIRTGKRLFVEGQTMHHCVYSYLSIVNSGKCCIYHLEYGGEPYTLEICLKRKKYYCAQMYSKYDYPASKQVWEYVSETLNCL